MEKKILIGLIPLICIGIILAVTICIDFSNNRPIDTLSKIPLLLVLWACYRKMTYFNLSILMGIFIIMCTFIFRRPGLFLLIIPLILIWWFICLTKEDSKRT